MRSEVAKGKKLREEASIAALRQVNAEPTAAVRTRVVQPVGAGAHLYAQRQEQTAVTQKRADCGKLLSAQQSLQQDRQDERGHTRTRSALLGEACLASSQSRKGGRARTNKGEILDVCATSGREEGNGQVGACRWSPTHPEIACTRQAQTMSPPPPTATARAYDVLISKASRGPH